MGSKWQGERIVRIPSKNYCLNHVIIRTPGIVLCMVPLQFIDALEMFLLKRDVCTSRFMVLFQGCNLGY